MQRIDGEKEEEEFIPCVAGAAHYLAVGDQSQSWRMALWDSEKGKWRAIDIQQLQMLANQMGMR